MNSSFGPWSTALNTATDQQLDTFWKRRLAMLQSLNQTTSRLPRRAIVILACLAIAALAIPTLRWASNGPLASLTTRPSGGSSLVLLVDEKSDAELSNAPVPNTGKPEPADEYFPRPTAAEKKILDALEKPVDVEFLDTPIEDCFAFLRENTKVEFWIDKAKLQEESVSVDTPVTLKLKGRRMHSVLNLLLRPLQLDYVIEDDVLKITTASSAGEKLLTRTYPVGDLCPELKADRERTGNKTVGRNHFDLHHRFVQFGGGRPATPNEDADAKDDPAAKKGEGGGSGQILRIPGNRFTNLIRAITGTIQPDSWVELSGPGSIHSVEASSCLVIMQTRSVHRDVLQLLRDLRAAKRVEKRPPPRVEADGDDVPRQF